jgi:D-aminoacyl-tRNA deacylase
LTGFRANLIQKKAVFIRRRIAKVIWMAILAEFFSYLLETANMRVVVQRTSRAEVWIDGALYSQTGPGLLLLAGTQEGDTIESARYLADKVVNLRIFEDDAGKMNRSVLDTGGEIMVVSQFTLYADTRKGRRPSFNSAQNPAEAEPLYEQFVKFIKDEGVVVGEGVFGAVMQVRLTNSGPVTIILDHDLPTA